jgi:hypothetical protein
VGAKKRGFLNGLGKVLGHVGITDVITLMGHYTSVSMTLAFYVHDEKDTQYLVGTPLLADYLEEGLSELGFSLEDFEIGM